MKIESMREFIVFSQYLSFTLAAKKLYVAQPTLSYRIQAMERELGFDLVEREPAVRITPAGKAFLAEAQKIVRDYDAMLVRCVQIDKRGQQTLRLEKPTGFPAVARCFFDTVNAFVRANPEVRVQLALTNREPLQDLLREGKTDAGMVFDLECIDDAADDIELVPVACDDRSLYVAVSADDPLAANPRLTLRDFDGRRLAFQADPRFFPGKTALGHIFSRGGAAIGFNEKPERDDVDFLWDIEPDELLVSDVSFAEMAEGGPDAASRPGGAPASALPGRVIRRIDDPLAVCTPCFAIPAAGRASALERFVAFVRAAGG